jgi:hypothetical protein
VIVLARPSQTISELFSLLWRELILKSEVEACDSSFLATWEQG